VGGPSRAAFAAGWLDLTISVAVLIEAGFRTSLLIGIKPKRPARGRNKHESALISRALPSVPPTAMVARLSRFGNFARWATA
jgi:hypothetical protein